jgi:hypothetical protein
MKTQQHVFLLAFFFCIAHVLSMTTLYPRKWLPSFENLAAYERQRQIDDAKYEASLTDNDRAMHRMFEMRARTQMDEYRASTCVVHKPKPPICEDVDAPSKPKKKRNKR